MLKEKADIIIEGSAVLTMDDEDRVVEDGAVAIGNGRIRAVGRSEEVRKKFSAKKRMREKDAIIMPGLVNTHTHAAMSLFSGVADDMELDRWLNDFIFPLEDKFVEKNFAYWGSLLACAEMVLSGTTTFCDMYFYEKETGRAAEKIGMRAVIGEGIAASGPDESGVWEKKKMLTLEMMKKFQKSRLISVAVEPHSPYACGEKILKEAKKFADDYRMLYAIHLSETKKEFSDFVRDKGMTPVEYLDSLGVLGPNTLAAHCVWMSKKDFRILKGRGVKISHCPQSNMKLASGIAPVAKFLKNGMTVSLGTDGSASNNTLDMFREMKSAALLGKVANLDPKALSARQTLRLATIGGAEALGKQDEIGSLEVGKKADIILVDFKKPHLAPVYDYYSHLVYCANGSDVITAIIDGRIVMENRRIKNIDVDEVVRKAHLIAGRVKRHLEKIDLGPMRLN